MTDNRTITLPAGEFAAYQRAVALLTKERDTAQADLARRSVRIDGLLDDVEQLRREIAAERRAREMAEARLYAYGDHQSHCVARDGMRGACTCGYRQLLERAPALVTELDAARAVIEAMRNPLNPPHIERLFAAYDATAKARAG